MDDYDDPLWIRVMAFALAAAVAALGSVGLVLALFGWYRLWLVLVVGAVVFAVLCVLVRPLLPARGEVTRVAHATAVLAVVAISLLTVWNAANASQQVLIIRDGGTYLNAGKWISEHGSLEVEPFVGPFSEQSGVAVSSAGMNRQGDHLDFTLAHMFPALLAIGQGVGGDGGMFVTTALLGGVALLGFYLLARRVLRNPIAALGATLCLGVLMPQVAFSRDSTTEITMQVLLFSAIWLLCDPRTLRHRGAAFVAGLFVGLLQPIHVDGLAFIMGLPFVGVVYWLGTERSERRRLAWTLLCVAVGVVLGVALGWFDLVHSSSHYLLTLRLNIRRLRIATVLAVVIAVALAWFASTRASLVTRVRERVAAIRAPAATIASVVVVVGGLLAWFARPRLQTVRRAPSDVVVTVQHATHLAIDPTRRYFEHALGWAAWYVGPITLTIAIIGAAYAVRAFVKGTLPVACRVTALILAPQALLYLWRPSITPDQIWAARRFVPAVFPIIVLAAFGVLCVVAEQRDAFVRAGSKNVRRGIAIALGALAIAFPVYTMRDVPKMTQQRNFPKAVAAVCRIVGADGAIAVPKEGGSKAWLYDPQTFRSFCNVPVAVIPPDQLDAVSLQTLARQWEARHQKLFLVAGNASTITKVFPGRFMRIVPTRRNVHQLVQTLVTRPDEYQEQLVRFAVARVPIAQ